DRGSRFHAGLRVWQRPKQKKSIGTLLIIKNYSGDCMNFDVGAEMAEEEGPGFDSDRAHRGGFRDRGSRFHAGLRVWQRPKQKKSIGTRALYYGLALRW
ncbi:MAG: dihydroxyacetone kinase subunit DhaK, partial [Synergistales bacterium]|nr:dihydroxyacetone kinase subunit DhaK [Synergistales bacterium]